MDKILSKKAFIFDLDGVLINNEPLWEKAKKEMFEKLFGSEISSKIGTTVGSNTDTIYSRALKLGATVSRKDVFDAYLQYAIPIYSTTPITNGIQELGEDLINHKYLIGIVSASPRE